MNTLNPLDWTAGPFLAFYAVFAAWVLIAIRRWGNRLGSGVPGQSDWFGVLHLAYLAGGAGRAAATALVALIEAGAATADRGRKIVRFDRTAPVPFEFAPFRAVRGGEATQRSFYAQFRPRWDQLRDDLAEAGLVPRPAAVARFRIGGALVLCLPLALGAAKVAVGLSRGRPVGFLLLFLALTVVAGVTVIVCPTLRTRAGMAALARARRNNQRAARAPLDDEISLAFALSGAAVLAGRDYRWAVTQAGTDGGGFDGGGSGDGSDGGGGCGGCGG